MGPDSRGQVDLEEVDSPGATGVEQPVRLIEGGLCKVLCGTLAIGICLQAAAAVAAIVLAASMITIVLADQASGWVVLGAGAILAVVLLIVTCALIRHRAARR